MRLAQELQPALLLLENVPDIIRLGLDHIIETLCNQCNYELRWMVLGAHHLGAPHTRRRWFCLAIRRDAAAQDVLEQALSRLDAVDHRYPWDVQPHPPVMTLSVSTQRRQRCAALGNSVVPDCVRQAFHLLGRASAQTSKMWRSANRRPWPTHGICMRDADGVVEVRHWLPCLPLRTILDCQLVFDPDTYHNAKPRSKLQRTETLSGPTVARRWTTPRHGNVTASNVLTLRTLRDLPSQVRFERDTPDALRGGQISAEFVEYMMGYPIGWTELPEG